MSLDVVSQRTNAFKVLREILFSLKQEGKSDMDKPGDGMLVKYIIHKRRNTVIFHLYKSCQIHRDKVEWWLP